MLVWFCSNFIFDLRRRILQRKHIIINSKTSESKINIVFKTFTIQYFVVIAITTFMYEKLSFVR